MPRVNQHEFAGALLAWYQRAGRKDLPWQQSRTPYRVWISEIMLQQTQVATVIPYYQRFMQSYPDVRALAAAELDSVLHHWTGLGYYARARNLHKTAKHVTEVYDGQFPESLEQLMALPGIGRSTAGAILALACRQRQPILDGNVKRVLCRYFTVNGWPGRKTVENRLWQLADSLTPETKVADYTQAIMDLGATVCNRRNPLCDSCPLTPGCEAYASDQQHQYPESKPRKPLPKQETVFAIIENEAGEVLLQQRPAAGIWGGLWCFPEIAVDACVERMVHDQFGFDVQSICSRDKLKHTFSHYQLMIQPVHVKIRNTSRFINDAGIVTWLKPDGNAQLGLPAPVVSLLDELKE